MDWSAAAAVVGLHIALVADVLRGGSCYYCCLAWFGAGLVGSSEVSSLVPGSYSKFVSSDIAGDAVAELLSSSGSVAVAVPAAAAAQYDLEGGGSSVADTAYSFATVAVPS